MPGQHGNFRTADENHVVVLALLELVANLLRAAAMIVTLKGSRQTAQQVFDELAHVEAQAAATPQVEVGALLGSIAAGDGAAAKPAPKAAEPKPAEPAPKPQPAAAPATRTRTKQGRASKPLLMGIALLFAVIAAFFMVRGLRTTEMVGRVARDADLRESIVKGQRERLALGLRLDEGARFVMVHPATPAP